MKDAQTFWDMYSQYIDDDIDSLQQVAGRNIITKTDFFKAFEEYAAPLPYSALRAVHLQAGREIYRLFLLVDC